MVLAERYFARRFNLCKIAQPQLAQRLCAWDLNYVFFSSFENALLSFELGRGKFFSFLLAVLSNEIIAFARKEGFFREATLRFDEPLDEAGTLTLHDSLPDEEADPRAYVEKEEALSLLKKVLPDLDELDASIVGLRIEGLSFVEISRRLSISVRKARYRFARYLKLVESKRGS